MACHDPEYQRWCVEEYRAEERNARAYRSALLRHPDPRDPDYPGPDCDADGEDNE